MRLVHSTDWLHSSDALPKEISVRLYLLDTDVQSVQLAFVDFLAADQRSKMSPGPGVDLLSHAQLFHHATVFVCAMRRVGRLAEALVARRTDLPLPQADAVQLAWRKKASVFATYTGPRNAIEHIDEELSGRPLFVVMMLSNVGLHVTEDAAHIAPINEDAVKSAVSLRDELVAAICGHGLLRGPAA